MNRLKVLVLAGLLLLGAHALRACEVLVVGPVPEDMETAIRAAGYATDFGEMPSNLRDTTYKVVIVYGWMEPYQRALVDDYAQRNDRSGVILVGPTALNGVPDFMQPFSWSAHSDVIDSLGTLDHCADVGDSYATVNNLLGLPNGTLFARCVPGWEWAAYQRFVPAPWATVDAQLFNGQATEMHGEFSPRLRTATLALEPMSLQLVHVQDYLTALVSWAAFDPPGGVSCPDLAPPCCYSSELKYDVSQLQASINALAAGAPTDARLDALEAAVAANAAALARIEAALGTLQANSCEQIRLELLPQEQRTSNACSGLARMPRLGR